MKIRRIFLFHCFNVSGMSLFIGGEERLTFLVGVGGWSGFGIRAAELELFQAPKHSETMILYRVMHQ